MVYSFIKKWFVDKPRPKETKGLEAIAEKSLKYLLDVLTVIVGVGLFVAQLSAPTYEVLPQGVEFYNYEQQTDYPLISFDQAQELEKEFHDQYRSQYYFLGFGLFVYFLTRLANKKYRYKQRKRYESFKQKMKE